MKRSLTGKRKKTDNLTSSSSSGGVLAAAGSLTGRLNKSDWDLRRDGRTWSESVPGLDLAQLSLEAGDHHLGGDVQDPDYLMVPCPRHYYTIDAKRLTSRHKNSQQSKQLLYGVKQFNLDPEKGLKYLEERFLVQSTPDSIAKFLFEQDRLSKKQIGMKICIYLINK